jgi:hypothetical protein
MRASNSFLKRSVVASLALMFFAAAAHAQDYKIKLARPDKVGDEFITTVTTKSDQSTDATINGQAQPVKNDAFTAKLHGVLKVLAVSEKGGGATKVTCKVDTLTKDGAEFYPAGTVITAERTGEKSVFTIDGDKVDDDKATVLDAVISLESPDRASNDDEQLGTDKPQKVGDTWPIDSGKVAKEISDSGLPITGDEIKGQSKLVEVKKINDTEVMVIETIITGDGLKGTLGDGSVISGGSLSGKVISTLPTDGTSPMISATNKLHAVLNINLPGGVGKATITTDREVTEEREPVKQ